MSNKITMEDVAHMFLSITGTELSIGLDDNDPNPLDTIEKTINAYASASAVKRKPVIDKPVNEEKVSDKKHFFHLLNEASTMNNYLTISDLMNYFTDIAESRKPRLDIDEVITRIKCKKYVFHDRLLENLLNLYASGDYFIIPMIINCLHEINCFNHIVGTRFNPQNPLFMRNQYASMPYPRAHMQSADEHSRMPKEDPTAVKSSGEQDSAQTKSNDEFKFVNDLSNETLMLLKGKVDNQLQERISYHQNEIDKISSVLYKEKTAALKQKNNE